MTCSGSVRSPIPRATPTISMPTCARSTPTEVDLILVERPPEAEPWTAVNDRLVRAALGSGADEET